MLLLALLVVALLRSLHRRRPPTSLDNPKAPASSTVPRLVPKQRLPICTAPAMRRLVSQLLQLLLPPANPRRFPGVPTAGRLRMLLVVKTTTGSGRRLRGGNATMGHPPIFSQQLPPPQLKQRASGGAGAEVRTAAADVVATLVEAVALANPQAPLAKRHKPTTLMRTGPVPTAAVAETAAAAETAARVVAEGVMPAPQAPVGAPWAYETQPRVTMRRTWTRLRRFLVMAA